MTCASCRYCMKLYVPPTHKDIPKDKYVCTYLLEDNQVMYLDNKKGCCEVHSSKRRKNDTD